MKRTAQRFAYPRAVAVSFPRGANVGLPGRPDIQAAVLAAALGHLENARTSAEIVDVPVNWTA